MKFIRFTIMAAVILASSSYAKVNINEANVDELSALKGIRTVKAEAIIEYRTEHGDFTEIEALSDVKGIGDATVAKIKDDIKLDGETDLSDISH